MERRDWLEFSEVGTIQIIDTVVRVVVFKEVVSVGKHLVSL